MWIDSHCHLNHPKIAEHGNAHKIITAAHENAIDGMLTVCCKVSEEMPDLLKICEQHKNIWCSIGTHPHNAGDDAEKAISLDALIAQANAHEKIVGIGESGLDYYYDNASREDQIESFRKHIRACIETNLPLIVHTRDAEEDTIEILKEEGAGTSLKGVMHCFSGSERLAGQSLNLGFYISLSGILTFKKAESLREIAKNVPKNRLLVETDAPYLAPMPYRGKTNHPMYVSRTGSMLAEIHGISASEMAKITRDNFFRLFNRAKLS